MTVTAGTPEDTTAAPVRGRFPWARYGEAPVRLLVEIGQMIWFALSTVGQIPFALSHYRKELLRLVAQMGMGTGAMAVVGGTAAIVGFITLSAGSLVAIQGYATLGNIGVEAFTGFLAALVNVRFVAPVAAGQALAATVGAGATAELGAMRISEEIDALEVMSIRSVPFLASTRVVAGLVVIIPLYGLAITLAFVSQQVTTVFFYGQSPGHVQPLLPHVPAPQRRGLVVRRGDPGRGGRDDHPLLLRLHRQRRSGRRR